MSNTMTTRDLAMTFYNEFVENGGDIYDPDSRFSKVMCEKDTDHFAHVRKMISIGKGAEREVDEDIIAATK